MSNPIEAQGLVKSFGSLRALDGLDLNVAEGTIHGFLGPNGSGKSTTIRAILGLYHLNGGNLRVRGLDPWTNAAQINRHVAYVPGEVALWPTLTGRQALDALAGLRGVRDLERERELTERFLLDPTKLIRTYSKGNRQKIMLVAALSAPVDLLLLDEPTSGLDPLMENVFGQCMREAQAAGKTILLSSHILAEVQQLCSHVTIIKDGKAIESGELAKLQHIGAREIRVSGPAPALASFTDQVRSRGMHTMVDGDDVVVEASLSEVPSVLSDALDADLADITCTEASLEELFLRHYEASAR